MAAVRQLLTRRRLFVAVVAVLVVIAASVFWATQRASATPAPRLGTATTGTVRQTVAATGTIAAAQEADLSFGVSGQVTAVSVTAGQQVAAGQALATINSAALPSQVAQAQAALASDQAKLTADAAASAAQRNADSAAVTAAQAQLAVAQQSLANATLTAPFAGTVAAVNVTVGQQVSSGGSSGSSGGSSVGGGGSSGGAGSGGSSAGGSAGGTSSSSNNSASAAQIVVLSTNSYIVNATVDDTQIELIKAGLQAQIVPDGATAPAYGTVSSVGMVATQSSGVASYPVVITVTGNPTGLHDGATAQVTVIVKQVTDVLVVPSAAVHQQGGASVVYEMNNGKQVSVPVTVGLTSGGQTQITGGIDVDAQVVLPAPAPGSTTTTRRGGAGGLGGGFGGGGGGFGGGGPRTGGGAGGTG